MKIHPKSAWSKAKIFEYLDQAKTPLRISFNNNDGYPTIGSLWYVHQDGVLWAASHKNSHIIKTLKNTQKIGFEIATNEYPYHGVRGKANITLVKYDSENVLEQVINKYLQGSNEDLSRWLMSRKSDEYSIRISPITINSWDFSGRMAR
ncbi:MAG: nitroimidazol reductase NimA-like FMN-containing flavoprotein [Oceanicoccus sp.]|jgi:nitroimidazol reductase NimA-like FMN-containing flavoprotein (pyridoxamine 5'-phosphate oxidase superfamily)